jgi:hypothetical protein
MVASGGLRFAHDRQESTLDQVALFRMGESSQLGNEAPVASAAEASAAADPAEVLASGKAAGGGRSLRRIALIVSVATALSKLAGLVRPQVIAAAFGVCAAYDAYNYA